MRWLFYYYYYEFVYNIYTFRGEMNKEIYHFPPSYTCFTVWRPCQNDPGYDFCTFQIKILNIQLSFSIITILMVILYMLADIEIMLNSPSSLAITTFWLDRWNHFIKHIMLVEHSVTRAPSSQAFLYLLFHFPSNISEIQTASEVQTRDSSSHMQVVANNHAMVLEVRMSTLLDSPTTTLTRERNKIGPLI